MQLAGLRLSVGGRRVPDPGPALQADRLYRQLLHPAGRYAAHVRADGASAGRAGTSSERRPRLVQWLARRPARTRYHTPHLLETYTYCVANFQ